MSTTRNDTQNPDRPLRVAQVIRDGGGTAPVELAVAARLREAGHRITVFGPPEAREQVGAAGFELEVLDWPSHLATSTGDDLVPRMIGAATSWARQLAPRFQGGPDVVVVDCAAFGALMAARISGVPCAAVMPTVYVAGAARDAGGAAMRDDWSKALAGINRARAALSLPAVASVTEQILDADRLLVLTGRAFELPDIQPPGSVRYVGPQLPKPAGGARYQIPDGDDPLVLVSLSTTDQGQLDLLERLLTAISILPIRALVTVGPAIDADRLNPPANTTVERFVPHAAVLPHADLVVTHAGHGTVMAAVSAGVPLLCLPMGRDQPAVAARVTHHGLGIELGPDADVTELRTAIGAVLNDPAYREAARAMAAALEPADLVVREIEDLARSRAAAPEI